MKPKTLEEACTTLTAALVDFLELLGRARDEPQPATRLYTYDDLAQMLGKSKSTVREWVRAGKFGEPVKVGNSIMVTQAGVDKYIADHSGPTKKRPSKAQSRVRAPAAYKGPPLGI